MIYTIQLYYSNIFRIEADTEEEAITKALKIREPVTMPDDWEVLNEEEK